MKTIKNTKTGEIKRVDDKKANMLTSPSSSYLGWMYCPKSEWKSNKSTTIVEMPETKSKKESKENGKEKGVSNRGGNSKKSKR